MQLVGHMSWDEVQWYKGRSCNFNFNKMLLSAAAQPVDEVRYCGAL